MNDPRCFDAHRGVEGGLTLFEMLQNKAADRAQFADVSTYLKTTTRFTRPAGPGPLPTRLLTLTLLTCAAGVGL
jgi:hypothetical protein